YKALLVGLPLSFALAFGTGIKIGNRVAAQRLEKCVERGMEYRLSSEDDVLRENDTLRGIYLTGQLPPPSVGVIPLDLPRLALQRRIEARIQVKTYCQQNSQLYQ
ncbi:MAG: hypothetical protein Q7K45_02720, partial [Nanoarchaeota archaeon]|nr:hypothetical protein [Nanoarchaeota archaeon]